MIFAATSINTVREMAVDFSQPYFFTARGIMMRREGSGGVDYFRYVVNPQSLCFKQFLSFMKPVTFWVWLVFGASIIVVGTFKCLINRISPYDSHGHFALMAPLENRPTTQAQENERSSSP